MSSSNVNDIFKGEVSSVHNYGAFVKIPGNFLQGLIHRSQVSSVYVDDVSEVLKKGERVWCKIISINEDGKIALSMKLVDQGNGKDLDPNGVQLELDEQRRKKKDYRDERKAIVLEAVYKTVCSRCKIAGHLAKDCFTVPGGKTYELLPDIDYEEPVAQQKVEPDDKPKEEKKKHKSKKSKKRKRSKSSKQEMSDSEGSDSSDEKTKKKKRKKEKKSKKKKCYNSSSESDSSDSKTKSHESKKRSKKCKYSKSRYSD